jgi:hypothetical protein
LAPRLEKGYITPWNLGAQFATLGANFWAFLTILTSMFEHLLVSWGQTTSQTCSKLAPSFWGPDSLVGAPQEPQRFHYSLHTWKFNYGQSLLGNKNVVLLVTSWGANWELGMHLRTWMITR